MPTRQRKTILSFLPANISSETRTLEGLEHDDTAAVSIPVASAGWAGPVFPVVPRTDRFCSIW